MATTAAVNGHAIESSVAGVGENVAGLAHDLISLAELQARLLVLDVQEGTAQARTPTLLMAAGGILALSSVPVVLLGIGGLLSDGTSLSLPTAWLLVSLLALAVSGICIWQSAVQFQQASLIFLRSREELNETMNWIKKVIEQTSHL